MCFFLLQFLPADWPFVWLPANSLTEGLGQSHDNSSLSFSSQEMQSVSSGDLRPLQVKGGGIVL